MNAAGPRRMQIAKGLLKLRERAGLKQEDVAKRAGYSGATVSRYEDWSNRARLKPGTLRLLAEACGAIPAEIETLLRLLRDTTDGSTS